MDTATTTTTTTEAAATSAAAAAAAANTHTTAATSSNLQQLCRICISSNVNCSTQMISLFGEDTLWRKITTLADVQIEPGDTLPQQVCVTCAKNTISACLFKKKCEDADNFFRQQLFLNKIESRRNNAQDNRESDHEEILPNGQNHRTDEDDDGDDDEPSEQSYKRYQRHINGGNDAAEAEDYPQDGHMLEDDQAEEDMSHLDSNGFKVASNGQKQPAFDFNSIRLMHEYMQQQLSKFNGLQNHHSAAAGSDDEGAGDVAGSGTDSDQDDEEHLPLIPEIELITPSDEGGVASNGAMAADGSGEASLAGAAGMTQMRGYQCPHCFQIFEMRQVLKAHMQSVHGTAGPVYECTNCKKTYFYKRFLEKHIRRGRCVKKRRNQTRPMQCSDCNVLFPTGHHLGWHKRTGCPSKTAKMPLQQLFKQNIVQYNNFPRRVGMRKPENALYLHNRKLMMANNKRKGRTRIKLDARKIALAKQLILREATTTVIANELNISRTFAWRLRKSLVNGVSLHERVIDPPEEEEDNNGYDNGPVVAVEENAGEASEGLHQPENLLNHHPFTEHIKSENADSEDEGETNQGDFDDHDMELVRQQQQLLQQEQQHLQVLQEQQQAMQALREPNGSGNKVAVATSVIQRATAKTANEQNVTQHKQQQQLHLQQQQAIEQKFHNTISVVQQQRLMELNPNKEYTQRARHQIAALLNDADADDDEDGTESKEDSELHHEEPHYLRQQQETECGVNSQEQQQQQQEQKYLKKNLNTLNNSDSLGSVGSNSKISLISQLSPAVAAAIHQLPVNLSIRPIASLQNNDSTSNEAPSASTKKKPRKPNVFIDDEKYAMAKMLVAQNASTMEIAKALNVSQMTAWKLRDAIIKGVPLSYRNRRDMRMTMTKQQEDEATAVMSEGSESGSRRETDHERQQQALLVKQQLEHQQKLQQQHLQQQQQIQQLLQRQQQLQQQQQQLEQQKQQRLQQQQLEEEQKRQQQLLLQQQQQHHRQKQPHEQKPSNPRRRLKAAEREVRDKEITREILELIKEDSNIQYWKVSARLAEKGYAISPSSVCQKLKSMGIHRRWKPGDKPPLIDMEHLKAATASSNAAVNNSIAVATLAAAAANAQNASSSADESYEPQFDMGGAHFLSAFTR
ncbi:uncharacterized protein LOC106083571 [Stomoxys calcitrans]|uniref:uncharacterized protein LOC106083571 n=1 Tax=Stomoxys calcitrans TaxID=35570 RepID=UPI0027E30458|nr:uncharacterized protein LOC106083571 [Stomoxys calcitrans]XP_059222971.1 uncharacterized protein LOC106083571 [Stomoxys calcitrans]XP_059222972.1 uncharacterized protein LOC106083571 [Stomoxys calcitrans]